jgi:DNA-binding transcriptional regulator YhcF (GntR family)
MTSLADASVTKFDRLFSTIRKRVISALHAGHLNPGDQLPSIREWVDETGANARAVMRAYRVLEEQGLVEVRGRSGVYLAEQTTIGNGVLAETGQWVVEDVLAKAWKRRIKVPDLPAFLHRCTASVSLRCAVLDAVRDQREAMAAEIAADFGMDARPVALPAPATGADFAELDLAALGDDVRSADLLVTTSFHATEVLGAADRLDKPAVVVQFNPLLVRLIEQRLAKGPLVFVVLDPRYEERLQMVFGPQIRTVLADDSRALAGLDARVPVLVSRAAQRYCERLNIEHLLPPEIPVIAPDCARELAHWLVHLNLAAEQSQAVSR